MKDIDAKKLRSIKKRMRIHAMSKDELYVEDYLAKSHELAGELNRLFQKLSDNDRMELLIEQ